LNFILIYFLIIFYLYLIYFFKKIFFNYYWQGYRRHNPIDILQGIEKELLQIPLTLFTYRWNNRRSVWWLFVSFTEKNTDRKKINSWNDIRFFCWWYVIFSNGNIDRMKRVKFFWCAFSVSKSTCKIIIDGLTNIPQITNDSFSDRLFSFMSSLINFVLTDCEYKYQQEIPLINLKIMVVCKLIYNKSSWKYLLNQILWKHVLIKFPVCKYLNKRININT